jgi:hypothetical protein
MGRLPKAVKVKDAEAEVRGAEVVDPGVTREEPKESPMSIIENTVRKRAPGNWRPLMTETELAELEGAGLLVGYDPETKEVLTKE